MSEALPSLPASRNAPILAAEAAFRACATNIVSLVLRRAHGGDPACLKLVLERALPAGRMPPTIELAPDYDPGNLQLVFGAIGAALDEGRMTIREVSRLLDALGAPVRAVPGVTQVRKFAAIEADLANALAAIGMDHFLTVAPRKPGGILENYQTNTEEIP